MSLLGPGRLIVDRSVVDRAEAKCIECQQPFKFGPDGNVFTKDGAAEVRISGMCEKCFDGLFNGMDDE